MEMLESNLHILGLWCELSMRTACYCRRALQCTSLRRILRDGRAELATKTSPALPSGYPLKSSPSCSIWNVVVHSPFVFVRETPHLSAAKLGYKWPNENLSFVNPGAAQPRWLRLAKEDGWMLIDGASLGLGLLLERCNATNAVDVPSSVAADEEDLVRSAVERVFPKTKPRPEARIATDATAIRKSTARGFELVQAALDRAALPERFRRNNKASVDLRSLLDLHRDSVATRCTQEVRAVKTSDLTDEIFASFVTENVPLLIQGALCDWAPLHAWTGDALSLRVGHRVVPARRGLAACPVAKPMKNISLFGDPHRMQVQTNSPQYPSLVISSTMASHHHCSAPRPSHKISSP